MRLERLNYNKIKIFLTFDDLRERGLTKEDLWHDNQKVHQLFRDMMNEASDELGFEADGPIAIEVYSLQAQGMVIIVTKDTSVEEQDDEYNDDYIEMQVTVDESDDIFYEFYSFEDIISLSSRLFLLGITDGKLYSYQDQFYLEIQEFELNGHNTENIIALLSEFGSPATITIYRVIEYGKELMKEKAIEQVYNYFILKSSE
ncbi:genetic competence negative regulator [Calidifontibacillus oryziterrae]|uniref:genetic competence negative regulator n=1 Tax=Calidifontibacillus oryziterrae TaxID=1191699 RepID=UPI0002E9740B|nr:genetic competence negative regulator [Calidifontibacillus oryziterrae]